MAASPYPRKDDAAFSGFRPDGAPGNDDDAGTGHGADDRVEMKYLPLKKRALNHISISGCGSSSSSSSSCDDDPHTYSPKKRRIDHSIVAAAGSSKGKGKAAAAGGRKSKAAAARLRSGSRRGKAPAKGRALTAGELWLEKWRDLPEGVDAPQPQPAPAPPEVGVPFDVESALSEAQRRRLAQLGATRPWFVHRKALEKSDVCPNQNRLLVSCKRDAGVAACALTPCFTPGERRRIGLLDVGLLVMALDRDGRFYCTTCKFLESNGGYRLITGWKAFLRRNGVVLDARGRWTRDVEVALVAFRSQALPRQPPFIDAKKEHVDKTREVADHLHPDGGFGLLLLHYEGPRRGPAVVEGNDSDGGDEPPPLPAVARDERDAPSSSTAAAPAAAPLEEAPAAPVGAEPQGEAMESETISGAEMAAKFGASMAKGVIGMMKLRDAALKEAADDGVREQGAEGAGGPSS